MPLKLENLTAEQIKHLSPLNTVFFFPVAALEDFGPHLPVSHALNEADFLAWSVAQRLEADQPGWCGVLMPRAPLGVDTQTTDISFTVRAHVLRDWLVDACLGLTRMGFSRFVCISGSLGPKQLTAIEEAGKFFVRRTRLNKLRALIKRSAIPVLISASSSRVSRAECFKSPLWPDAVEHGGVRDTSIALVISPDSVRPEYLQLKPVDRPNSQLKRMRLRAQYKRRGYWGDPAAASAQRGKDYLADILNDLLPKLRAAWGGANPNAIFRSWYSLFPPNGSFFKAWTFAVGAGLILILWMMIAMKHLLG